MDGIWRRRMEHSEDAWPRMCKRASHWDVPAFIGRWLIPADAPPGGFCPWSCWGIGPSATTRDPGVVGRTLGCRKDYRRGRHAAAFPLTQFDIYHLKVRFEPVLRHEREDWPASIAAAANCNRSCNNSRLRRVDIRTIFGEPSQHHRLYARPMGPRLFPAARCVRCSWAARTFRSCRVAARMAGARLRQR